MAIRVLLTNDDGPPSRDSPFILGLYLELQKQGYDVKVVIPSSQKSWIGKAYQIKDKITGRYYYPRERGDIKPETSDVSRPLKDGELAEWILLDGTPATCANIALHNLYPSQIDLVISGPNYGRNTSSAFMLSSGTIGAALSSSLSQIRSIALSYGVFTHPSPPEYVQPAHDLATRIVKELWTNWGADPIGVRGGEVDLYNVNLPLAKELLDDMDVVWTRVWRNQYESLFQPTLNKPGTTTSAAGPEVSPSRSSSPSFAPSPPSSSSAALPTTPSSAPDLTFHFAPKMTSLVNPPIHTLPFGTDAWAVHHGKASVTPLRTSFAEPDGGSMRLSGEEISEGEGGGRVWVWGGRGNKL